MTHVNPGSLPHLLLTVACAEPLAQDDLLDRLALRGHLPEAGTTRHALHRHKKTGLLRVAGKRHPPTPGGGCTQANLYVLTSEGEAALDAVWGQRE